MRHRALTTPLRINSLVDTLVERLETAIFNGELPLGSKLKEEALAQRLGVSRGPLREAIRRLEGRKLIQRIPNIGARVASFAGDDLKNVLVIREVLEGLAARLACEHMTDSEIASLRQLLDAHGKQKGIQQGTGYYQESKDFDFHFRIIQGSRNERLISMLCGDLYHLLRLYRYKHSQKPGRAKDAYEEHMRVLEAVNSRNPDHAEAAMRKHLMTAREHVALHIAQMTSAS